MSFTLTFAAFYDYDPAGLGIDVPLTLRSGALSADVRAKIDCGSTYCVFRRITGIRLGFDIERGIPQWIGTAMGDFLTYGHEVSLNVLGIETVAMVYFAAEEHFNRNILGRIGLLDRVRFGLVDHDSREGCDRVCGKPRFIRLGVQNASSNARTMKATRIRWFDFMVCLLG